MVQVVIRRRELTVWSDKSSLTHSIIVGGVAIGIAVVVVLLMLVVINTRQAGDPLSRVPLTKKRSPQSLAEESLTFSPDPECCPPSTVAVAVLALTMLQR
jgi:hypothetical protein